MISLGSSFVYSCHIELSELPHLNKKWALFNCPVMAYKTAFFLEKGAFPYLPLSSPNRPRPLFFESLLRQDWSQELFTTLGEDRGIATFTASKVILDQVMNDLGPGTHAIISADFKNWFYGHFFNYAHDIKGLTVLDSYTPQYHALGVNDPDKYFELFYTRSLEAAVFYDKTPQNEQLISLTKKK